MLLKLPLFRRFMHTTKSIPLSLSKEQRAEELKRMNQSIIPLYSNPLDVIKWAMDEFDGNIAMSTSMGIQASVLLHLATQIKPDIPVVWVDTGYLPAETYKYGDELKQVLGLNLIVVNNSQWSAARIQAVHGPKLWERDHILYGKLTKVDPLNSGLNSLDPNPVCLLSGLRSVQTKARANMDPISVGRDGRYKLLPMLKMSDRDVVDYMFKHDLPHHPLHSKGYVTVGDWHSSRPAEIGEDGRATRFGGKHEECTLHVLDGAPTEQDSAPAPKPLLPPGLESLGIVRAHEETDLAVIMVKKTLIDGSACQKCQDVANKILADNVQKWIGHVAVFDSRDVNSEGNHLAARFELATAPFFLVRTKQEQDDVENWKPLRSYLQLKKMLFEAAEKKKQLLLNSQSSVPVENPKLVEHRRHLEEIKSQIALLEGRSKEIEHQMSLIASKE